MLKIQRASAGSGKTYTLAKNFILNLIAFVNPEGKWRLRNARQIEDGLKHILAITFTNKATNEMKQRIVNNLSLLSKVAYVAPVTPEILKDTPYLQEFHKITGASYQDIGKASEEALRNILNNYSQFRISTIDSFFQEILRTFAYEANLNDSFTLEIDSTFVTDSAIDASIRELDTDSSKSANFSYWMRTIIKEEAQKSQYWNPFNKRNSKKSVYRRIRETLTKLEREDFKEVKECLDSHFNKPGNIENLPRVYENLITKSDKEREDLLQNIKNKASELRQLIDTNGYTEEHLNRANNIYSHINTALSAKFKPHGKPQAKKDPLSFSFNDYLKKESIFKVKFIKKGNPVDKAAMEFYNLVKEWQEPSPTSSFLICKIYAPLLPYLGLILEVRKYLSQVLERNNIIQLSDTSYILKKIIGEDDTPFVYERLGNRIDHYLIDEFQDTSKMQWEIIHPLLSESEAKGQDSLIIGDPKQSIYRFRNANHTLITKTVPNAFPNHIPAGFSEEDNTNWRSHTRVVKFNNFFFKNLASIITGISEKRGIPTDFNDLYSNVVQTPGNKKGKGYVEIRAFEKPMDTEEEFEADFDEEAGQSQKNWFDEEALSNVGPLISSLLERGYNQKDIGILVNTNEKGKKVVQRLIDYNDSLPEDATKINFISEESLLVSSSRAVDIVIGVLEKLTYPGRFIKPSSTEPENKATVETSSTEDNPANGVAQEKKKYEGWKWNKIKLDYSLYSMHHQELEPAERIISFLNENKDEDSLKELMASLSVPSLTSLIETIIQVFLDEKLKNSEALYLTSLQDLVNEFSTSHINDPAVFLDWWKSRGNRMAVSTPEGSNAVQIMTIHKSKGLEFKCVILPFTTDSFSSKDKAEWRWVETTATTLQTGIELPPILPVNTDSSLTGSVHEMYYREFEDQILTDKLNMFYVAFTRARNELYVFTKYPSKKGQSISDFIKLMLFDGNVKTDIFSETEQMNSTTIDDLEINETEHIITLGEPLTSEEIESEHRKENEGKKPDVHYMEDYFINKSRPALRAIASKVDSSSTL